MIELTVDWQESIQQEGEHDPLRSEYGNLVGFCDDDRLGHRIVVVKPIGSETARGFVFRAIPNLDNDVLSGQELSINGTEVLSGEGLPVQYLRPSGRFYASNQNPFRPWADVPPDDNGNIPTVDLEFTDRAWVDEVSVSLGVPLRAND